MIDVDEVEAGGFLAKADLAGAGLADLDFFPFQDLGTARTVDSDCVTHRALQGVSSAKEKPRFTTCEAGLV
jgi:hypothetical protein